MRLAEELMQKQVLKFQLDEFDKRFIRKTLSGKFKEGLFNLGSGIKEKQIFQHLLKNYGKYELDLMSNDGQYISSVIAFRRFKYA